MNSELRAVGDLRIAVHIGDGPGCDVAIRLDRCLVGLGEGSVEGNPAVRERDALIGDIEMRVPLPLGHGQWMQQVGRCACASGFERQLNRACA